MGETPKMADVPKEGFIPSIAWVEGSVDPGWKSVIYTFRTKEEIDARLSISSNNVIAFYRWLISKEKVNG